MSNNQTQMFQPELPNQFIYAVFDSKTLTYRDFFVAQNDSVAQRLLTRPLISNDHDYALHSEDFALMQLGTWNAGTGFIERHDAPKSVITLLQLRATIEQRARFLQGAD